MANKDGIFKTSVRDSNLDWDETPGFLINHYIAKIGPSSGKKAIASKIKLESVEALKEYLRQFLRTDGFCIQLLAFKLKKLQPAHKVPEGYF